MKFFIRRTIFALLTAPLIALAYGLGYVVLALAVNQPMRPDTGAVWCVAVTYFLFISWYPQINKSLSRLVD